MPEQPPARTPMRSPSSGLFSFWISRLSSVVAPELSEIMKVSLYEFQQDRRIERRERLLGKRTIHHRGFAFIISRALLRIKDAYRNPLAPFVGLFQGPLEVRDVMLLVFQLVNALLKVLIGVHLVECDAGAEHINVGEPLMLDCFLKKLRK